MHTSTLPLFSRDLWETLRAERRDIWLYGMGNGADKLLSVLEARGIPVAGVFASDGFVRGHEFHGMRVHAFSEVCNMYEKDACVVLLAFGSSRPEVLALFDNVAQRYPLLVPDLPVCGNTLFDAAFYAAHEAQFEHARALLADEASRALFDTVLSCKYTGEYHYFDKATSERRAWDLLLDFPISRMLDLGAYNGDSAREAMAKKPMEFILCAEPDKRNFKKLSAWAQTISDCKIECHGVAVCDTCGEALFDASGNRNAGLCTGRAATTVQTASPDALLAGRTIDYIKYDVEGAEAAALRGSSDTIKTYHPALRVALYHRPEDMFALPLLVRELYDGYSFYLVRERGCPAWDLDLIALPK